MSDAFACTSANCRAEVLEELINETDRPMFFSKEFSTPQYVTIPTRHFFATATSWVGVRADLLLGYVCASDYSVEHADDGVEGGAMAATESDVGLSAFADDVAKKVVGRSEEELF